MEPSASGILTIEDCIEELIGVRLRGYKGFHSSWPSPAGACFDIPGAFVALSLVAYSSKASGEEGLSSIPLPRTRSSTRPTAMSTTIRDSGSRPLTS